MPHLNPLAFLPFGILLGTAFASTFIATLAARLQRHPRQAPQMRPTAEILRFPPHFQNRCAD